MISRTPAERAVMQLCKVRRADGNSAVGVLEAGRICLLDGSQTLSGVIYSDDPAGLARSLLKAGDPGVPIESVALRAPLDDQEVWAAGVTYKRSREARERESAGAARFYDLVYNAARPELFFKAPARRVVDPGGAVRIRRDSRWNVPEPELALVLSPTLKIVGYTIGNDMSSRDIEGENPLYLPQAKCYDGACALGPAVTLAGDLPSPESTSIRLLIARGGAVVFDGATTLAAMQRSFEDLASWLGRETSFPDGVVLLTGTGVVPPDDFTLAPGDEIAIEIAGVGKLTNVVGA
jgi:2-dehydro-3-deoxy-D-arabinonate dehydratase